MSYFHSKKWIKISTVIWSCISWQRSSHRLDFRLISFCTSEIEFSKVTLAGKTRHSCNLRALSAFFWVLHVSLRGTILNRWCYHFCGHKHRELIFCSVTPAVYSHKTVAGRGPRRALRQVDCDRVCVRRWCKQGGLWGHFNLHFLQSRWWDYRARINPSPSSLALKWQDFYVNVNIH